MDRKCKGVNSTWHEKGTVVMMEVNMSSTPRILRFFVNGEQQKMSVINIPESIQFAVSFSSFSLFFFCSTFLSSL
jgi:hypothetical protein